MMWLRIPKVTDDGVYQRGRLFDCGDMISARLDGTTMRINIAMNSTVQGVVSTSLTRSVLDITNLTTNNMMLTQWNHFLFTLKGGRFRVFLNGRQVIDFAMNNTILFTGTD